MSRKKTSNDPLPASTAQINLVLSLAERAGFRNLGTLLEHLEFEMGIQIFDIKDLPADQVNRIVKAFEERAS
jgi:hypothetical protein